MKMPVIRVARGWQDGTVVRVGPTDQLIVRWDSGFERIVRDHEVFVYQGAEFIPALRAETRERMKRAILRQA